MSKETLAAGPGRASAHHRRSPNWRTSGTRRRPELSGQVRREPSRPRPHRRQRSLMVEVPVGDLTTFAGLVVTHPEFIDSSPEASVGDDPTATVVRDTVEAALPARTGGMQRQQTHDATLTEIGDRYGLYREQVRNRSRSERTNGYVSRCVPLRLHHPDDRGVRPPQTVRYSPPTPTPPSIRGGTDDLCPVAEHAGGTRAGLRPDCSRSGHRSPRTGTQETMSGRGINLTSHRRNNSSASDLVPR